MNFSDQNEFLKTTLKSLKMGIDDQGRPATVAELAAALTDFLGDTCEGWYIDGVGSFKYDSCVRLRQRSERVMNDIVLAGIEAFSDQFYNLSAVFMSREFCISKFAL